MEEVWALTENLCVDKGFEWFIYITGQVWIDKQPCWKCLSNFIEIKSVRAVLIDENIFKCLTYLNDLSAKADKFVWLFCGVGT